jgi:ABC-type multidrug transport system fused ATPase/permease subunit
MQADFGYYEEGHLGKPYDLKLLRRLYRFIRPYRKWFVLSILLALLTAAVDLSFPYLVKEAIDRYIVRMVYPVHVGAVTSAGAAPLPSASLEATRDPAVRMLHGKESLTDACEGAIFDEMGKLGGDGGVVAVSSNGEIALVCNSNGMFRAWSNSENRGIAMFGESPDGTIESH